MSLFGQEDQDAPELRGGFFRRLRTPRANFVEPSTSSTEPKVKRSRRSCRASFGRNAAADDLGDARRKSAGHVSRTGADGRRYRGR